MTRNLNAGLLGITSLCSPTSLLTVITVLN
jgi:hypothetical protein